MNLSIKMGCDYYVQTELIIKFKDDSGVVNTMIKNQTIDKRYVYLHQGEDSDDETDAVRFADALEDAIEKNTYKKNLFENGNWIKQGYKNKFFDELPDGCDEKDIVIIYKNIVAWARD